MVRIFEGYEASPYYPEPTDPNPTIGIGFNLNDSTNLAAVLDEFGVSETETSFRASIENVIATNYGRSDSDLQSALNSLMGSRALSHPGARSTFAFNSEAEAKDVFDDVVSGTESFLTSKLTVDNSEERATFLSLAWNVRSLIGNGLVAAFDSGDRAEAWYQIRYVSNGDHQHAARRYAEAQVFGLNPDSDLSDALLSARMYTKHETAINSYDNTWSGQYSTANGDLAAIASHTGLSFGTVGSIEDELSSSKAALASYYSPGFNPEEVWVAPDVSGGPNEIAAHTVDRSSDSVPSLILGGINNAGGDAGANDTLTGGSGQDFINGFGGDDVVNGGPGNDTLVGAAGNDTLVGGAGNNSMDGGAGNDSIQGGAGDDTIDGGDGLDTVNGGGGADKIIGAQAGADTLIGGDGDDTITGGDGNESISGGDGVNSLSGGAGNDTINSQTAHDTIDSGDGDDSITSTGDDVTIHGGAGDDVIIASGARTEVWGGPGDDYIDLRQIPYDVWDENLAIVHFGKGEGHDYLAHGTKDDMPFNGVYEIVLDDVSSDDIQIIWNYTETVDAVGTKWYLGEAVIKIISTGDTLVVGDLDGGGNFDFPIDQQYFGPNWAIRFSDGEYWGSMGSIQTVGQTLHASTTPYESALGLIG